MYWHQLHRRYTQLFQIADDRRVRQGRERSPDLLRDIGETSGKSSHMRFVNDGIEIRYFRGTVIAPVKTMVDNNGFGRNSRIVAVVADKVILSDGIAEQRVVPFADIADR